MPVRLIAAKLLVLLAVVGSAADDVFTARIGIMVRLHGVDGARLGEARDDTAGAAIMAIKHIRSRNVSLVPDAQTLHPKFNIEFEMVDTRSDSSVGVQHAVTFNAKEINCIVGAARSAVSGPVALVAGLTRTPVLSYSSTAASLGTSTYPMFSRVIPNDALTALSFIKVCQEFGWKQIALMFLDDSYGQGYTQSIQNFAAEHGVDILVSPSFSTGDQNSIQNAVYGVQQSGARIIFCISFAQDIEAIATSALEAGIMGKGYVWLTGDSMNDPAGMMSASPDPARLLRFLTGFLTISTKPLYGQKGETFDTVWQHEKKLIDLAPLNVAARTYTVVADDLGDCSDMCGYIYDSVWAAALAVNAAVDWGTLAMDKPQLISKLREQNFQGSTGTVSFDAATGDRAAGGISVIYQNWVPTADGLSIRIVDLYEWGADGGVVGLGPVPVWGGGVETAVPPPDGLCGSGLVYSAETLSCLPCEAGTAERIGVCVACAVGKVAPSPGSAACVQCESGYADEEGMTECKACPEHAERNSSTVGVSRAECLCSPGYFSEEPGGNCSVCVPGAVCPGKGLLPQPRYGFWGDQECRQYGGELDCGERWLSFYECEVASACPGGQAFACAAGHTDRLCTAADAGWFKVGGTFHFQCGKHGKIISICLIGLVVLFWYLLNKIVSAHYDALDIALLFVQTVGMISTYGFKWHPTMEYLNLGLSVANFDVDFVTPDCLMDWSMANSFFLQLMLPLIFAVLKMGQKCASHLVRKIRGRDDAQWVQRVVKCGQRRFLAASIMLYHTLCQRCFEVFKCEAYPDGNFYMTFAPQTQCWTPMHKAMIGVSIVYIVVIIVGTPLTLWLVIRSHKINHTLHSASAMKQWGFVHTRYEAEFKYWETMLVLRRGLVALLRVFLDSPMLKGAVTMVGLTGLLSAHVFTKPYVDSQIDVLDFCSILGSMLYCLAGILSYPSITARTQGVICSEGAENPPECGPEMSTKLTISVITLGVVCVTLAVSVYIAWTNVIEIRKSEKAAKIVKEQLMRRGESTLGELADTVNKVSLCEMLDGRLLLPWASKLQARKASFQASFRSLSIRLPSTPNSHRQGDVSEHGRAPSEIAPPLLPESAVAYLVMRKLTEIHGLCDWLSCASPEAKLGVKTFVDEFVEFLSVVEGSDSKGFPLSEIVREEHLPLMSFWLMGSEQEDMMLFWKLVDSILESGHAHTHNTKLINMSTNNLANLESAESAHEQGHASGRSLNGQPVHPWLQRRQHEMLELWSHQPDHMELIRSGRQRRASLPLLESRKASAQSLKLFGREGGSIRKASGEGRGVGSREESMRSRDSPGRGQVGPEDFQIDVQASPTALSDDRSHASSSIRKLHW